MGDELLVACALVLVLEGMVPFLSPRLFRHAVMAVLAMDERSLRVAGLISMVAGVVLLYVVH